VYIVLSFIAYGGAPCSRLLKMIGLFWKKSPIKETYIVYIVLSFIAYGGAPCGRLLKMIGLFWKRAL